MPKEKIKQKVNKLREQIKDLRYKYHVLNDPEVTDAMYEGLMDKLRKIEQKNPELITPDSPTQRIAGEPLDEFEKVEHKVRQWSFDDAFDRQDLLDWEERIMKILEKSLGEKPDDLTYIVELKIDGLHIVLDYENGELQTAATRGDGEVGEDVTQNIKTIHSIPITLDKKIDLIAEGEVWMSEKNLERINKKRRKREENEFANPRNAAAGTIRQLDAQVVADRGLSFTTYDISAGPELESQKAELEYLKELDFPADEDWKLCDNIDEIMEFYEKWKDRESNKPYWIDGLVIKVNERKYQDILGFTGKAPRWAIAMKFPAEQGTSKVKEVYWQVGRTGKLTPVALLEPVELAGTTVTHATLHNYDEIERLGVREGDNVVVEKAGDIIPQIVRVLEKMRSGKEVVIKKPQQCPICGADVRKEELENEEESAAYFCTNEKCYAKEKENIIHFVSKPAFNIDGLGEKIVEQLLDEGLIKDAGDIFSLKRGDLEPLERFAQKAADNLITAIDESKQVTLPRFLYSLGIRHVGEETAHVLAQEFGSICSIKQASREELEEINDIGPRVAKSIVEYFRKEKNIDLLDRLQKNGVKIEEVVQNISSELEGKKFVFTGSLDNFTRKEAKNKIRELGASPSSSVSSNTDYVVVGKNPGSKQDKAKDLGVGILNEDDFLEIIN